MGKRHNNEDIDFWLEFVPFLPESNACGKTHSALLVLVLCYKLLLKRCFTGAGKCVALKVRTASRRNISEGTEVSFITYLNFCSLAMWHLEHYLSKPGLRFAGGLMQLAPALQPVSWEAAQGARTLGHHPQWG